MGEVLGQDSGVSAFAAKVAIGDVAVADPFAPTAAWPPMGTESALSRRISVEVLDLVAAPHGSDQQKPPSTTRSRASIL